MNNTSLLQKLLKYLVAGLIIYLILSYMPNITHINMGENEAIIFSLIIVLIYVIFDNLWNFFYGSVNVNSLTDQERTGLCNSVCSVRKKSENMDDMQNVNNYSVVSQDMEKLGNYMQKIGEKMNGTNTIVTSDQNIQQKPLVQQIQQTQQMPSFQESQDMQDTQQIQPTPTGELLDNDQYKEKLFNELVEYVKNKSEGTQNPNNPFASNNKIHCQFQNDGTRSEDGLINDDTGYSYNNHFPLAVGFDSVDYEYGYSFLPPSQWYPKSPIPPVCVTDKQCPVQPIYTVGSPVDVKEWDSSRRIMPPDRINIDYIKKLNGGR